MTKFFKSFLADESGAVASEYAVLLVLIAAALVTAVVILSGTIQNALDMVADAIVSGGVTKGTAPTP